MTCGQHARQALPTQNGPLVITMPIKPSSHVLLVLGHRPPVGLVVLTLLTLSACPRVDGDPPLVRFIAPGPSTTVDDSLSLDVTIEITHTNKIQFADLLFDNETVDSWNAFRLQDCAAGCTATLSWRTIGVREGDGELVALVGDENGNIGEATRAIRFDDMPTGELLGPDDGAQFDGVGFVELELELVDRSPLELDIQIDGDVISTQTVGDDDGCALGCSVTYTWDNRDVAAGAHDIEVIASDPLGHALSWSTQVSLADVPYISDIGVTGEDDFFGTLEVEAHLIDGSTGEWLGCSGEGSGLREVDGNDVVYPVAAWFERPDTPILTLDSLGQRQLRVRVIEDDNGPCPGPEVAEDDFIGESASFSSAQIDSLDALSFGNVIHLELATGRPFKAPDPAASAQSSLAGQARDQSTR